MSKKKKVTPEQLELLEHDLTGHIEIAEELMDHYKIESLSDLPKDQFIRAITRIRDIKMAHRLKTERYED